MGWVNVGVDHETAAFAVASIHGWWYRMGLSNYAPARRLLITADSGGSNGALVRLRNGNCKRWSTKTGLEISVCHFPPGASKWNKIEHRLFSFITQNWRGNGLVSHGVIMAATISLMHPREAVSETKPNGVHRFSMSLRTVLVQGLTTSERRCP